jgi:hypothetical protein
MATYGDPFTLPMQLGVPALALSSNVAGASGATALHPGEHGPAGRLSRTMARFLPPARPSRDNNRLGSSRDLPAAAATQIIPAQADSDSQLVFSSPPAAVRPVGQGMSTVVDASGKASFQSRIRKQGSDCELGKAIAGRKVGGAAAAGLGHWQADAAGSRASPGDAGSHQAAEAMALCGLFRGVAEGAVSAVPANWPIDVVFCKSTVIQS